MIAKNTLHTLIDLSCSEEHIHRFKQLASSIDFRHKTISHPQELLQELKKTESVLPFDFNYHSTDELHSLEIFPSFFLYHHEPNTVHIGLIEDEILKIYAPGNILIHTEFQYKNYLRQLLQKVPGIISIKVNTIQYLDDEFPRTEHSFQKLIHLLKKDKTYLYKIFYYAVFSGLASLIVPLGIESLINFLQLGRFSASGYLLIFLIIFGVFISGILRIFQLWILEILRQKIFAGMSFDFMYHLTQIRYHNLRKYNPSERINRLMDVVSLQKNLSSVLIDLSSSIFQIIFGLIILCFYHPFFIAFTIFLYLLVYLIIKYTGKTGLLAALKSSTYKYYTMNWLQQMARSHDSLKSYEYTNMHYNKLDAFVSEYIVYRRKYFHVLLSQYFAFLGFSIIITGGLLVGGYILLIKQSITLGQFLASEIIVLMITGAVEKLIMKIESIYEMITSAEKISQVQDISGKSERGLLKPDFSEGISISFENFSATPQEPSIEFTSHPGDCQVLSVHSRSSINALTDVLLGIRNDYLGSIKINGSDIKLIDEYWLNKHMNIFFNKEVLFDATVRENITLLHPDISDSDILNFFKHFHYENIFTNNRLTLDMEIAGSNYHWGQNTMRIMLLARCVLQKPKLFFVDELLLPANITINALEKYIHSQTPQANIIIFKKAAP